MTKKPIHLAYAIYNHGTHPMGWTQAHRGIATDIGYFTRLAQTAEAAKFDMLLRADNLYTRTNTLEAWCRNPLHMNGFEPLTLLAALSQVTSRIGMVATVSTTYSEPYNIARALASLDHMSGGRAAWNIVTSYSVQAAQNFGHELHPGHDSRYGRASEFVEAVQHLWDTYDDDAVVHDPDSGLYIDPERFHITDFAGKVIKVRGGLNICRPPQGYPVAVQAGSSPQGRAFAARVAEVIFTNNNPKPKALEFYADMKARTAAAGRDPDHLKILPGLTVLVGDTEADAQAEYADLEAKVPDIVKIQQLSEDLGASLHGLPKDQPVPLELIPDSFVNGAHTHAFVAGMIRERQTLAEMMSQYRRAQAGLPLCTTAAKVADLIEERVEEDCADGFTILVPNAPKAFERFCRTVVPELQRRGSFRREYEGTTLREHLGLPRPASRYASVR